MSKKKAQHLRFLDAGIFPATILFSHGYSYDELMEKLPKKDFTWWHFGLEDSKKLIDNGNYFGLKREVTHKKKGKEETRTMFYIIIKEQFLFTDYEYCKLAHEVLHICQFALPDFLNRDREYEAEAYLHTHIMKQCLTVLRGGDLKKHKLKT